MPSLVPIGVGLVILIILWQVAWHAVGIMITIITLLGIGGYLYLKFKDKNG